MIKQRAQALIVSLWILMILTILAVSIGHRVSLALKLSRYQRDKLKALYLAKAGVNRVIIELKRDKDSSAFDALSELWADNEEIFKKIVLNDNQAEFGTVSYTGLNEDNEPLIVYGACDEESKINVNTASEGLLIAILEYFGIDPSQDIADNIRIWRGDTDIPGLEEKRKSYEDLGYLPKADKFNNIEELILVKDITPTNLERMKGSLTIYGDGMININTVSPRVLTIFTRGIARSLPSPVEDEFADSVVTNIVEARKVQGYFRAKDEINIATTGPEEQNIFNALKDKLSVQSNNFSIAVIGNVGTIKSGILSVYNRNNGKTLYWHES